MTSRPVAAEPESPSIGALVSWRGERYSRLRRRYGCAALRLEWAGFMDYRRAKSDEQRLLVKLTQLGGIEDAEAWVGNLRVREMQDGGMGSLDFLHENRGAKRSGNVTHKASVQFADEDGVMVIATLYTSEDGSPLELDVWKTDFSSLRRIPQEFQRLEG